MGGKKFGPMYLGAIGFDVSQLGISISYHALFSWGINKENLGLRPLAFRLRPSDNWAEQQAQVAK